MLWRPHFYQHTLTQEQLRNIRYVVMCLSCGHFSSRTSVFLPSHLSQTLGGGGALRLPTRFCWVADCGPDGCLPFGLAPFPRLACLWPLAYGASGVGYKSFLWCPVPWCWEFSLVIFGTSNGGGLVVLAAIRSVQEFGLFHRMLDSWSLRSHSLTH